MSHEIYDTGELGSLLKVHPRDKVFCEAEKELNNIIEILVEKHSLTYAELLCLLSECIHQRASRVLSVERKLYSYTAVEGTREESPR
jgi:hypothetical protein